MGLAAGHVSSGFTITDRSKGKETEVILSGHLFHFNIGEIQTAQMIILRGCLAAFTLVRTLQDYTLSPTP